MVMINVMPTVHNLTVGNNNISLNRYKVKYGRTGKMLKN